MLLAERQFWSELDEIRVHFHQKFLRPYLSAVRRASGGRRDQSVAEGHAIRVECALAHLPFHPLRDFGLTRMVAEAKANVGMTMGNDVIDWLPAAEHHFRGL
jgi:hypothetical protein